MNYPLTRHLQRYEYVSEKGYVDGKVVVDMGCGPFAMGSFILTPRAKFVYAIDRDLMENRLFSVNKDVAMERFVSSKG